MNPIFKAVCWAAVILLLALGNAAGLVADSSARVMFTVLPIVAWMSLSGKGSCDALSRRFHGNSALTGDR